jgi:hypothetical protein
MSGKHSVYVVELDSVVMESKKFRKANEGSVGAVCVYVGCTGLSPEQRLANHKAGKKANTYVQLFGMGLLRELFEHLNPMPYDEAVAMEHKLAEQLRNQGFAVWSN